MDWDDKVAAPQPRCAHSGRVLAAGEAVFAALVLRDGTFTRHDFAPQAWPAVDQSLFISWWRRQVPKATADPHALTLDGPTLLKLFHDLKNSRVRAVQCLAYVMALCLLRIKKVKLLRIEKKVSDLDGGNMGSSGTNHDAWLLLEDRSSKELLRLRDPLMTANEEAQVQAQLLAIIGPVSVASVNE